MPAVLVSEEHFLSIITALGDVEGIVRCPRSALLILASLLPSACMAPTGLGTNWAGGYQWIPVDAGGWPRIPTQTLFDYLEGGDTIEDFLEGYPTVSRALAIEALEEAKQLLLANA